MHRWHDIGHTLTSISVSNNRHYIRSRRHANWMERLVLISMAISRIIIQTTETRCPLWSLQSRLFLLQFLLPQLQRSQTIFSILSRCACVSPESSAIGFVFKLGEVDAEDKFWTGNELFVAVGRIWVSACAMAYDACTFPLHVRSTINRCVGESVRITLYLTDVYIIRVDVGLDTAWAWSTGMVVGMLVKVVDESALTAFPSDIVLFDRSLR